MKKRNIYITETDKNKLKGLFSSTIGFRNRDLKTVKDLLQEIERAKVIPENGQTLDVVTMNSTVQVYDLDLQREYKYTIVYPEEADSSESRISILAPVGTALLGYRRGDVVEWEVPAGKRRLKIMEVYPRVNSLNVSAV
jgi:regulator of nucleoside diphosphate kinase